MFWSISGMRARRKKRPFSTLVLATLLLSVVIILSAASAQDEPMVVFIIGQDLGTSSYADTSPLGLSELAIFIDSLDVTPRTIAAGQPIPNSAQVVVVSRPVAPLPFPLQVQLWDFMQRGGHILLTIEPDNYFVGGLGNLQHGFGRSSLNNLIRADYGLDVTGAFLAAPWMSPVSIVDLPQSYSYMLPSDVRNPITDPLAIYEVPVRVWGASHIDVEPLGVSSYGLPLLYSPTGYGETNRAVFPEQNRDDIIELGAAPLEMNIGEDILSRMEPAAIAVNTQSGSRLVVLGDSELLQNRYGFAGTPLTPDYPGNRIFVERLIAWMLEIPVRDWPPLPAPYTWVAVDGQDDDWGAIRAAASLDDVTDEASRTLFTSLGTFRDDVYAYFRFVPQASIGADGQISLQHQNGTVVAREDAVFFSDTVGDEVRSSDLTDDSERIEEARFAVGNVVELRLPLRYLGPEFTVDRVCLDAEGLASCIDIALGFPVTDTRAPFDHTLIGHMTGIVTSGEGVSVNMRAGPSTDSAVISFVPINTPLAVLGRDSSSTWVYTENANYAGWVAALLLTTNGDVSRLPVIEGT